MIISRRSSQLRSFLLYGGAHLFIVVVAAQADAREAWYVALPSMAALSLYGWIATFRRYRAVGDMPTSTIASAAQGYVELLGQAYNHPDWPLRAKLSQKLCCWFAYEVEERESNGDWRTIDSGESVASFLLRDRTGECTIDPEGAEILCAHKETRDIATDRRYTEWRIHEGDTLYVLGEFKTRTLLPGEADVRADMRELLAQWKRDPDCLLRRYDLDKNGELDMKEWALARAAARREVERNHRVLRTVPSFDSIERPADGRLYLLSNHPPEKLARRFVLWSWTHLGLFFAILAAFLLLFLG
ncbi:MAG TPA: hypothetical protein VKZ48_08110 [Burkholderiales bacterium]|nr:hypothetical protein [Burkholderiales bacterium]